MVNARRQIVDALGESSGELVELVEGRHGSLPRRLLGLQLVDVIPSILLRPPSSVEVRLPDRRGRELEQESSRPSATVRSPRMIFRPMSATRPTSFGSFGCIGCSTASVMVTVGSRSRPQSWRTRGAARARLLQRLRVADARLFAACGRPPPRSVAHLHARRQRDGQGEHAETTRAARGSAGSLPVTSSRPTPERA